MSDSNSLPRQTGEVSASDADGRGKPQSSGLPPPSRLTGPPPPYDGGGNPEPITARDISDVVQAAVRKAKEGDMYGAEVVRRYWKGRRETLVLDIGETRTAAEIAEAQGKLLALTFAGTLTPREGRDVSTMIENRRKALHTLEQQRQLDDILELARRQTPNKKGQQ